MIFFLQRQLVHEPRILSVKPLVQGKGQQTSTATLLTLGYGYCFPLGYNAPINRGITMLGTSESFIIRKASLSPSGDHQWAMWECRSSSRINECYLKPTVEMWAQWPTNICPWNLHCSCTFSILVLDFINFIKHSLFLIYSSDPTKSRCKERKEGSNKVRMSWVASNVNRDNESTIRVKKRRHFQRLKSWTAGS